ncbi:hypothetical protein V5F77_28885 [Xanthobacter sp. DSM 24535]|uniref:hypothetical protein n=1 Tax=Roseixanthobacter psychrophilus TaxID=3119917 RepID=UPI00372BB77C
MSTDNDLIIDLDEAKTAAGGASDTLDLDPATVVDEDADLGEALPKRAVQNGDGTITLPLRHPVTLRVRSTQGGERTEEHKALTFHRLLGADLRAITSAATASQPVVLLARSARIREAIMNVVYDKMDGADIADATAVVAHFFDDGRKKRG